MQTIAKVLLLSFCCIQIVYAGKEFALSALTLDQVTKKVIEQNKSKVMGAETEVIDGKTVYVIKVLTSDGRVQYLNVDAETGRLIK